MSPSELVAWRKRMGWTQREAAQRLGYSERHYIRMETGEAGMEPVVDLALKQLEKEAEK